ncbi:MAG TPA: pirin family protein [Candidatus Deferrimicrobium sp.]|nr:pirin family protein [Candidatus Deferrimicrobium sp.]
MIRKIKKLYKSQPTIEGAGVHLKRAFGNYEVNLVDPFLLLDDFHSDNPEDYIAGFPWHPHRGIETITYMIHGKMEHGDSLGNGGIIQTGDVQWMTAGSGIIHQEMPQHDPKNSLLWGFQLWANLPATHKMMQPRYRDVKNAQIPEITLSNGVKIKIICGEINGTKGPVQDIVTEPEYLDVFIPPMTDFTHKIKKEHTIFAYLIEGEAYFDEYRKQRINAEHLVIFDEGDEVQITTADRSVRFLLISGKPLKEPIAWYGPIVMNTEEELQIAFEEYQRGTFIKHK